MKPKRINENDVKCETNDDGMVRCLMSDDNIFKFLFIKFY